MKPEITTKSGSCRWPVLILILIVLLVTPAGRAQPDKPTEGQPKKVERAYIFQSDDFGSLMTSAERKDLEDTGRECLKEDKMDQFEGNLVFSDGVKSAEVKSVCTTEALLFLREKVGGQAPISAIIQRNDGRFVQAVYVPGAPLKRHQVIFFDEHFIKLCENKETGKQKSVECKPDGLEATILPRDRVSDENVVKLETRFVVVEFRAPADFTPEAVSVRNEKKPEVDPVLARILPGPRMSRLDTHVSFTVVDYETVKRNFGRRIADRYTAVDLQVRNPRPYKVQFRKSAVWFEVDYESISSAASNKKIKLDVPDICAPDRVVDSNSDSAGVRKLDVYRYGLEHEHEHHPHQFLSVLGSFEAIADWRERGFRLAGLFLEVATGLKGSVIRGRTYGDLTAILSGIALPRARSVFLNEQAETRKRTQLIQQSFEDLVQVAAQSSATTKIFLPNRAICSQFDQVVRIQSIRDAHLELEVVSDVITDTQARGKIELGMSEAEVIKALGLPDGIETIDGGKKWTFSEGAYKSVTFTDQKLVNGWDGRSVEEQLALLEGKATTGDVKRVLGLRFDASRAARLVDGGEVWLSPGELKVHLRFNATGTLKKVGYKTAYEQLLELEDTELTRAKIEAQLLELALTPDRKETIKKETEAENKETEVYSSPDLLLEKITIEYKDTEAESQAKKPFGVSPPRS